MNFYLTGVLCANCEKTFSVKESSEDTEYNTMDEYCRIEECRKTAATCSKYQKIIEELHTKVNHQKKTLDDYRHLNMTSFDEIAQLESDIRDKEDFINRIKKERSDIKKDVKFLNEKIEAKNNDILRMHKDSEEYVKIAKNSIKTLEEENMYLKQELDEFHRNLENKRDETKSREKRLLDEVKLLETEIDHLKKVNIFKELQLNEIIAEK